MSDKGKEEKKSGRREKKSAAATDSSNNVKENNNSWALQVDRMAIKEPLVDCMVLLAGYYGRRTSSSSLTSGLPISAEGITPSLLIRAAKRADLNAVIAEKTLDAIAIAPNLPCVLVLANKQACILKSVKISKKTKKIKFITQFPETPDEEKEMSKEELQAIYSGYVFFVRPVARTDDRAGPAVIDNSRSWFWSVLKDNKKIYMQVVLAAVMINIFALSSSIFIMNVYDRVIPNNAFDTLKVLAFGVIVVFLIDFFLKELRAQFLDYAGRKADVKISASLFEQILGMKISARPASAGVLASNMKEFETLRDFFTSATMASLIDLPFMFFFVIIIAIIGGPIAFVPAIAIPIVVIYGLYLQAKMQKIVKESMHESALKNALLFETITGLEALKTQAAEGHTQRKWEELTDKASRLAVKSKKIAALSVNFATLIQQLASVAIVIVGVFLISEGDLKMGALIACVIMNGRAMAPLSQVAGLLTRLQQSREALTQLNDLMKKPVERPANKHFVSIPDVKGKIEFKDVIFTYPGQTSPALNNVRFTVDAGEKVGIIGAVGSGKTTLERLLLNLYEPDSGSVLLDGTDVRQIDPGDLRRNIGNVQQLATLFYGTVRENITMGHETASDAAVIRAAELSGVMEFLRDSELGLDTPVGERGEALSGGQRQAVAIARALLYDPPVFILDEPTASLDPASENRLIKRLKVIGKDKTTILITHKGSMLSLVDKLILVDKGRIVAYGPRDEVIAKLQARQYGTQAENDKI